MKTIQLICILIISSCASKKEISTLNNQTIQLESDCPSDGKCEIKILQNQSLEINKDEFGSIFYKLKSDNSKSVVVYKYDRNIPEGVQDGSYREEIILEYDNQTKEFINEKSLFGRFCYCKGQTGYYKIEQSVEKSIGQNRNFQLKFDIKVVPQVVKNLKFYINK